jgi:hypothetical protein
MIMKNFTSHLFKLFVFSCILFPLLFLGSFKATGAGTWNSTYYLLRSENIDNGEVELDFLYQKVGGDGSVIPLETPVYLQYQTTGGSWINCFDVYQFVRESDGTPRHYDIENLCTASVSHSGGMEDFNGWGAGNYHMYIYMSNPTTTYNSPILFRWVQDGDVEGILTLTFYKPTAPIGLFASTNACNQINLTWSQPSNYRAGTNTYEIYRDNSYLNTSTTTSYTDNTPADGTSYSYKVRMYNNYQYGEYSSEVSGNSKAIPVAPTNVSASSNRCNGTIYVQWQWSAETPNNFEIQRSTSSSGTFTSLSNTIPGDRNYYEDTPPLRNTTYYYKVSAKNDCLDWGTFSSAASGMSPNSPAAPTNFAKTISNNIIHLTWTDNSSDETKFLLTKANVITGITNDYELAANTTSYNDSEVELCVPYTYKLKAVNSCGNSSTVMLENIGLTPDLSNTFWEGSFKASKGYYPDIVHLEWDNRNRHLIDIFYIYRKVYGTSNQILLTTLNGTLRSYDDKYAANGVLYEYSIKAEGMCDATPVASNIVSSVGFKVPTATINGKVTYRDGNPTKDVTITAESTELPVFSSISLNGTDAYMQIDSLDANLPVFTFQSYIRFDVVEDAAIFNRGTQYKLNYTSGSFVFDVGGNALSVAYTPPVDTFIQVTTVFSGDSSFIYIDGELKAEKSGVSAPPSSTGSFIIGKEGESSFFDGYIDEIRLWKTALTSSQVGINYNKYINGNETDLIGYYRLNENVAINMFFDVSRSGNSYNENHGTLHNCTYANVNPLIEQLWFKALTDETGNYLITGIPYLSGGSIYKIVPMLAPHEFNPGYKTLFVGDGASVHNNIDFSDISTVPVTVQVFYNNTTFPVKGVWVKLDGQVQVDKNEQIVQTNEDGTVTFEVPYGNHYLSFEKQSHQFEQTYYPGTVEGNILRHNFNEPVQVNIKDITRVKLAGKVVGGPIEAAKDLLSNTNPTKNNIGVVSIELTTERGFNIDSDDTPKTVSTTTDPETGYFEFSLLPEKYKPDGSLSIKNSLYTFNSDEDLAIIDMSSKFLKMSETDSIFVNKIFSHLDTTAVYNLRRDWIYRSEPEFSVLNKDGGKIISATEFIYDNEGTPVTIPLATEENNTIVYPFGKPIFFFGNEYSIALKAFEEYVNADNNETDQVPVTDGVLIINNDLALQDKVVEMSLDKKGEAKYKFLTDFPNIADPYTKNLNITFKAGSTIVQWPANGELYEAYILGGRPTGNNFVTTGPSVVDYILRDPPGSGSSATLEKGFVNVQSYNWSLSNTTDMSVGLAYQMGVTIATQAGSPFFMVQNQFETDNFIKGTIQNSYTGGTGFQQSTQLNFNESFSTSDDPLFVGSDGDVFIGHSTNIIYGISKIMKIMPDTEVPSGTNPIAINNSYAIAIEDGLRINPEFDTYFIYSQRIIENENIPHLIKLRNIILEKNYYTKVFTDITDPRYGSNNDDNLLWGSSASDDFYDGPSYKYTGPAEVIDSVRFYNQQIANWKEVLAMNEQQKLNALADEKHQNISFGAGSVYQSSIGSEDSYVENTKFGFSVSAEVAMSLGFAINKFGFRLDAAIKNTTSGEKLWSDGSTTTTNVGYTLSDQDPYNYITTDVLKCQSGNGPVFKTRGGQTSCPHEPEELTQYFDPGNQTLNFATMRIEGGKIAVANPVSPVVPETSPAIFTVYLTNVSEAEKDGWYIFGVDNSTNPYGAKIMLDGSTINDGISVFVPYGKTLVKTLEVWKGQAGVNEYEDLSVYLGSTCENYWETVEISAYFESACSQVEFEYPGDGWVINVNDDDKMLVKASGYNLQHAGFEDFHFQYTPTGSSNWTTVHIFTNDPSKAGEENTTYINGATTMQFLWDMSSLPDRGYDIRLVSHCANGTINYSQVLSGTLDGQRPQVFGTPQPADGILDVDDNIMVQFNEPIEGGLLTQSNFDVKGTLNNYPIKHQAFLRFNGTSDYSSISEGLSFNDKQLTVEFWMKPNNYNNSMVILSQGNDPANSVEIGLQATDKTYFKIGANEYVGDLIFPPTVPRTEWQHMAYVFDNATGDVFIYQNGEIIKEARSQTIGINNSCKIYIGKSAVTGGSYFAGNLHELRIWSKIWSIGDIYANQYTALTGNEIGLYGYWPLDDAYGNLAVDKAASRHMEVFAPWIVEPGGSAWDFSGSNFLEFFTGYFAIIPEMDYTLEFWFKASTPAQTVCLFSNQKGDGTEGEGLLDKALSIYATPDGKIWVASKGNTFEATSNNYFNDSWHHFALVVNRRGNVISLIDGKVQNENQNTIVGGIANDKMYLGVRKWDNLGGTGQDNYFSGKMDEFRLWNLAKSTNQILLDMNSKLHGDEFGLMVYLPFEGYSDDGFGNQTLYNTMKNFVSDAGARDAVPVTAGAFSPDAPNIKDARPVENIPINFVAAEDQIIITPEVYLMPQLEKNILEIAVEGVEDRYGNVMASPVKWTAFVHRNQVRWEDERRYFSKEVYQPLEFIASIKNTGGQQVGFSITNLPVWLKASPVSGVINPESTLEIKFTVNPALNIGDYNQDIILRTENGFDEKLPLTIRVYMNPPNWKIDPSRFENSMTIVGKVKIDGVFSTDIFDMVAAFKKGTDSIRGVSNIRYIEEFDSYLVFLTVYGNVGTSKLPGDSLAFQIWDASAGQILDNVKPLKVVLIDNTVMGTTLSPTIFESTGYSREHIALKRGWNWVSFNKLSPLRSNLGKFLWSLEPSNRDMIKTHGGSFSQYNGASGLWSTGITSIDFRRMYQMKTTKRDTIIFSGTSLVPEDNPIPLVTGWNHIGYIPDLTMDVTNALRNFVPSASDIIKSQSAFSMYDSRTGWIGTLDVMRPGEGYMFKLNSASATQLIYPGNTLLKSDRIVEIPTAPLGWENDLLQYEGNLSIVAKLDVGNLPDINTNNQMVLGAFIQDECHGYVSPLNQNDLGYSPFFLNVSNSELGQQIEFRLFDGLTGKFYSINEVRPFVQDAVYGTIQEPLVLTLKGLFTGTDGLNGDSYLRCYPNPFNNELIVEFSGNLNVKSIDVLSTLGSLVTQIYNGNAVDGINLVRWNGTNGNGTQVAPGIYYLRVITDNGVETMKISKTK